jgi:rod shape-determining protein MreD
MAWGIFWLVLAVVFVLQTTVLHLLGLESVDLLLALALVCALTAPVLDARLAGWCAGFAQDIGGAHPLGLHAFALGLVALVMTYLRDLVNQQLWWARWLLMFVVTFPAELLIHLHLYAARGPLIWSAAIGDALATTVVAATLVTILLALAGRLLTRGRRRPKPARW